MDDKKVVFIICVNNELYFKECVYYINRLVLPEGYSTDIIAIRGADSMCAAYNAGMHSSDAKYKIYLHQDVMIRESHFLENIIALFLKKDVGLIGMIGGNQMPKTGVTYRAWDVGMVDCRDPEMAYYLAGSKEGVKADTFVEAVDGLLIATQYDISWREDLFKHFDFYDVSQSFEMRKAGYKILVPYQKSPWVIHDSSFAKLTYYDEARKICLREYPEYLYAEGGFDFTYDREWNELSDLLSDQVKALLDGHAWDAVREIIESYRKAGRKSSTLETIGVMYDIYKKEKSAFVKISFFSECADYQSMYHKYMMVRFLLRRMELGFEEESYQELICAVSSEKISCEAVIEMVIRSVVDRKTVLEKIMTVYKEAGLYDSYEKCRKLYRMIENKPMPMTYSIGRSEKNDED